MTWLYHKQYYCRVKSCCYVWPMLELHITWVLIHVLTWIYHEITFLSAWTHLVDSFLTIYTIQSISRQSSFLHRCKQNPGNFQISLYWACIHMYVAPLESYRSGLFSTSIVSLFGMIISIKDPLILKDLIWIVYSSGSHGFLSPKISWKYSKESDMARALKLWYRGGLGSIWFSPLQCQVGISNVFNLLCFHIWLICKVTIWTYKESVLGPHWTNSGF